MHAKISTTFDGIDRNWDVYELREVTMKNQRLIGTGREKDLVAHTHTDYTQWLVMSIGNQKFGIIPRKYQYQIGIWYFCPKFLGTYFIGILSVVYLKFG